MSNEIHQVIATIRQPKGSDTGQITYGYFTIEDGLLTMTDGDGTPMRKANGDPFTHKLRAGENWNVIAKVLTLEIWRMVHGKTNDTGPTGFNRPINYSDGGISGLPNDYGWPAEADTARREGNTRVCGDALRPHRREQVGEELAA